MCRIAGQVCFCSQKAVCSVDQAKFLKQAGVGKLFRERTSEGQQERSVKLGSRSHVGRV